VVDCADLVFVDCTVVGALVRADALEPPPWAPRSPS
jgi:hypothetical protein